MPAHCAAPTIIDFLKSELDKKLASLSASARLRELAAADVDQQTLVRATQRSSSELYRFLIMQGNIWRRYFDEYAELGKQPFGGPHPEYGKMDAFDFRLLLTYIDQRKTELERAPA